MKNRGLSSYPAVSRSISAFDSRFINFIIVKQRQRMNLDVSGDDEFLAGKTHSVVRNKRKRKCFLRVSNIHHHLGTRPTKALQVNTLYVKRQQTLVDKANIAFGA